MKLKNLLTERKSSILNRWFDVILKTYPPDTSRFLMEQKDRFANPVGHFITEGIGGIFDDVLAGIDPEKVAPFLDNIIRVRAIQDFTPSGAISFVFLLKGIVREELKDGAKGQDLSGELDALDRKIDHLALIAFDVYMKCREDLHEIRVNEIVTRTSRLLEMANMKNGVSDEDPGENERKEVNR